MSEIKVKKFRLKGPSMMVENFDVEASLKYEGWKTMFKILNEVDFEKLHSFKVQLNFKKEQKSAT